MKRFFGRRALTAIPLVLALVCVTLFWNGVPRAMASATPTITVTGYPGPGDDLVIGGGNWPYGDPITITYDGTPLATTRVSFLRGGAGSATGAFSVTVQVPLTTTLGAHTLAATDTRTNATAQTTITVQAEWTQFGFTSANTRYNPYETAISAANVNTLTLAWTYQAAGAQPCSTTNTVPHTGMPSVAQGNVVFENPGYCQFVSLNAASGAVNWTALNSYLGGLPPAQAAVADGAILDEANYLAAYSTSTGASLWQSSYSGYAYSPVAANGMIYATGNWNNQENGYSLDAYSVAGCGQPVCAPVWSYSPPGGTQFSPAVANGSVYYGNWNASSGVGNQLLVLDAATGTLQWSGAIGDGQAINTTAVDNGYVIFTANIQGYQGAPAGTLYVFNAAGCGQATCQPLWTATNAAGWGQATAEANGVIYVGGQDGALYAFNEAGCQTTTCAPLWQSAPVSQTPSSPVANPAVANGVVYYTSGPTGEALAYDAAGCGQATTCSPLWDYSLGGMGPSVTASASPVIANGMLYVSDDNGALYAFSLPATVAKSDASASQTSPATPAASSSPSPRAASQPPRSRWPYHQPWYQEGWALGQSLI
jgi:outer membrane protein assembly factor BamB